MPKTEPVSVRLDPKLKTAIDKAAKADRRSTSSMIEKILADYMVAKGLLKE